MSYSTSEQGLYDHARATVPRFLFSGHGAEELWGAFVKMFDACLTEVTANLDLTFIREATGEWLDQHAKDRGTGRIAGESDDVLRERIITTEDAIIRSALLARIVTILETAGAVAPDVGMVELRRDGAFAQDATSGAGQAYADNGYRAGSGRPYTIVVILPYGTSASTALAVDEYLRGHKAAGYRHVVETRAVP